MGLLWIYQVKELCNALAPLSAAMQSIGGESYCSLSLVGPLLHKLISKVMVPAAEDTPIVYDFKAAALSDLSSITPMPVSRICCQQPQRSIPAFGILISYETATSEVRSYRQCGKRWHRRRQKSLLKSPMSLVGLHQPGCRPMTLQLSRLLNGHVGRPTSSHS